MDGTSHETQKFPALRMSNSQVEEAYKYDFESLDLSLGNEVLEQEKIEDIRNDLATQELLNDEYKQILADRKLLREQIFPSGNDHWPIPVNLARLILNAQKIFNIDSKQPSDLHPLDIIQKVKVLSERLIVAPGEDELSKEAQTNATLLFNILLRSTLSSKRILQVSALRHFTLELMTN